MGIAPDTKNEKVGFKKHPPILGHLGSVVHFLVFILILVDGVSDAGFIFFNYSAWAHPDITL
jgi:hypothetical protein